ncbi:MAG: hypothetical protein D3913_02795 [Candidatus Electrothrix sp. LOE1_4_5]|nr:hypothetical protein [Candidatus Electrothrix gigas]MCI5127369.1 hypothetical protein [Candidatus Electrothrix gigas]MCI5188867.1 hypothetical protein [Candidatus Electrothrix gigas]
MLVNLAKRKRLQNTASHKLRDVAPFVNRCFDHFTMIVFRTFLYAVFSEQPPIQFFAVLWLPLKVKSTT